MHLIVLLRAYFYQMRRIIPTAAEASNSAYFIAAGSSHCTIPSNAMYTVAVEDQTLIAWISDLIAGEPIAQVVDCCAGRHHNNSEPSSHQATSESLGTVLDVAMQCAARWLYHTPQGARWAMRSSNLTKAEVPQLQAEFHAACDASVPQMVQ